ncbi:DUF6464 domain-containing protein [Tumidithrix helvetica PCC 7403]|uniref:DUF6464 family protein n=1 Tax=Tumidithrix helvetica TaxID=3457545 RepID=UPI003C892275
MQISALPTEVRVIYPDRYLGKIYLDWMPQPGNYLELEGKPYTVLERRHRYQFRNGRYALFNIVLYVQPSQKPSENSLVDGRWVVGDATCRFNARSEIMRCAVNPLGPCEGCRSWEKTAEA